MSFSENLQDALVRYKMERVIAKNIS